MIASRLSTPWRITLTFIVVSVLWIVGSDYLATLIGLPVEKAWYFNLAEDLVYVIIAAAFLFSLIHTMARRYEKAEAALRDNQWRWQFALEGAGDGMWDWNLATDEMYFSPQCIRLFGYAEEEIGRNSDEWRKRIHPADRPEVEANLTCYLTSQGEVYSAEYRMLRKEGSYTWVLARGQIIARDKAGRPLRFVGVITDISIRKLAEQRMADTLAFNQAILGTSPVGILTYRPDGAALTANEAAGRMVGATADILVRQNFRELESWRRYGFLDAAERALVSGEPVTHTAQIVTSFGRTLWLEMRFSGFRYEGQLHLLAILSDETEKKRTTEELSLLHAAALAAPSGWVITDINGTIEWVNPAFSALTGYAFAEVVGRKTSVLKSGEHAPQFYTELWKTILRGEVWRGQLHNRRKDGTLYHEEMTIAPVRDARGTIAHFVAMKHDMSEQKRLEQQAARTQRLESIGLLASGIAHDLNNILAPILLSIELLKIKFPTADAKKCLDVMENAGQRGAGVVRQVLTFARGIDGARTDVHPKHLLKDILRLVEETFPRSIRAELEIAPAVWPILGDLTQLHQVLLNLAVNARDAMPAGGVLTLGAVNLDVEDSMPGSGQGLTPGRYVALRVADTGSGIPADVLEHIFEPFFTTKPRDQGTGLGLSTVFGIVRSHGGRVEVKTEVGAGTTFLVLLPASAAPVMHLASAPPLVETLDGAGRCILVVDDEKSIRHVTTSVLESHGFSVLTAGDGQEGLEMYCAQPGRFAAVVTDIMMPRMNGYELIRQLRHMDPTLPIIASSGVTGDRGFGTDKAELDQLGVNTVLVKPYTEVDLLRAMRNELATKVVLTGEKKG